MKVQLVDLIVIAVLVLVLGAAICYIRRAKKKGVKCIGCPSGLKCSGSCAGCSGHCCEKNK